MSRGSVRVGQEGEKLNDPPLNDLDLIYERLEKVQDKLERLEELLEKILTSLMADDI